MIFRVMLQHHYTNGYSELLRELVIKEKEGRWGGKKKKRMVKLEGVKCFMPCNGVWGKWHCGNYTLRQKPSYLGTSLKQHFIRRIGV